MKPHWQNYFRRLAEAAATMSKDPSLQVGCILVGEDNNVLATGYNGFARGVLDLHSRYHDKEGKLTRMIHAEANAVAAAARSGAILKGCTAVITKHPCSQCAALLIQAGATEIICPPPDDGTRWEESYSIAASQCTEAGVTLTYLYEPPL